MVGIKLPPPPPPPHPEKTIPKKPSLIWVNKTMKEPGTNFQSPALSQKHIRNAWHTTH